MNLAGTALRFFFHTTLGRAGFGDRMARIPSPERLPVVLSPEEVALLLAHAPSLKYRAALMATARPVLMRWNVTYPCAMPPDPERRNASPFSYRLQCC